MAGVSSRATAGARSDSAMSERHKEVGSCHGDKGQQIITSGRVESERTKKRNDSPVRPLTGIIEGKGLVIRREHPNDRRIIALAPNDDSPIPWADILNPIYALCPVIMQGINSGAEDLVIDIFTQNGRPDHRPAKILDFV